MNPVIRLDAISKHYGSQTALDGVSFEVSPGTVFALLGENGAGKTTAIRIMLGLVEQDRGEAHVLGLDSRTEGAEIRRKVGYVPERPTLYEWMTVDEIGWFTAGFYANGFLPKYRDLAAGFDLPPSRRIRDLSKGMRAKVVLSLAMAHEPQVLILDEPTSGLDTLVRREFLESMVDVAAQGRTVFLSSHQIPEVERVADVVAILREGRLLAIERLDELKRGIRELTITLADSTAVSPALPGEVLSRCRRDRQLQAVVRGATDEQLAALRSHAAVREVQSRPPALEEIFVAYMGSNQAVAATVGYER